MAKPDKWIEQIDEWVGEITENMGMKLGAMRLQPGDHMVAQVAMARALIHAGCVLVLNHTGEEPEATREMVDGIVEKFFEESEE